MNILLNLILLSLGIAWFNRRQKSETTKPVLPVILAYIGGAIFLFVLSLVIQSDYLDGILYILSGGLSLFMFWIYTTVAIIYRHNKMKTTGSVLPDLAQSAILLVPILILFFLVSGAQLKIGG
jgi:VIT1/CCC1 family predicted Fe2+/Mn2+ transporter